MGLLDVITAERTTDLELVGGIMRHARVYRHISDDTSPPASEFTPSPMMLYVAVKRGGECIGAFMFHPHTSVMWEAHTCLLPSAWGLDAIRCTEAAKRWMFENTPCQRLITAVPDGNHLALRLAKASGMVEYGHNPASFLRGGRLIGQTMLGINKGETCQQQQ